jgi:hypothetical protein
MSACLASEGDAMTARDLTVPVCAALTGAALLSVLSGCSSKAAPVAAPPARTDLTNSSWAGPCAGAAMGPYTFAFGAGNSDGGSVKVTFPDATTVETVPYTLQSDGKGETSFTLALDPPWKGSLQRDYRTLRLSYRVGDKPGGFRCDLVRNDRTGPNGS